MTKIGPDIVCVIVGLSMIALTSSAHIRKPISFIEGVGPVVNPNPLRMKIEKMPRDESEDVEDVHGEYEDFPQEPTYLQASYYVPGYQEESRPGYIFKTPSKRYLGIEIPDYVSSPSKGSLLKTIQNRMKAAGK